MENMKSNKLKVQINKPIHNVFLFTITPPNSTKWISSVIKEETNEWPIKKGTVYKLTDEKGKISEVIVSGIKEDVYVEWESKDNNYHCRYTFEQINNNVTKLEYFEWIDKGKLTEPFTFNILQKLKLILES